MVLRNSSVAGEDPTLIMVVTLTDLSPYRTVVVNALTTLGLSLTPASASGFCIPSRLVTAAPAPAAAAAGASLPLGVVVGASAGGAALLAAAAWALSRRRRSGAGEKGIRRKPSAAVVTADTGGNVDDRLSTPRWANNPMARGKATLASSSGLNEVFVAQQAASEGGAAAPASPGAVPPAALLAATSVGAASPLARGPSGRLFTPVSKARTAMASPSVPVLPVDGAEMDGADGISNPMVTRTAKKAFEPMAIHGSELPGFAVGK